jgi:2-methylcitrate dehydratase PrpD
MGEGCEVFRRQAGIDAMPMTSAPQHLLIEAELQGLGQWLMPAAKDLPTPVMEMAQRLWLDTLSCAWAGLRADELLGWLQVQHMGDAGDIALPGTHLKFSASAAATALAMGACWDEACEGLALAHGRPGVPIVAALWSQLTSCKPSWQALWQATAVGYEVAGRLGARLRIKPGMHVDGVWGAFGAAAAVVHLRGGTWADIERALQACAVQLPFTLYKPIAQGKNVRNMYLGHSAWLGLQAANAVAAGLATPVGAIDEFSGLALDEASAGGWPGTGQWLISQSYWKPFAAVRHVHYGAQAALKLRLQLPDPAQIEELRLTTYAEALQYCGNRAPQTVLAAQFSLSFGAAAALVFGDLSPDEFRAPRFLDVDTRRLEALITLESDASMFPAGQRGARLSARVGEQWSHVHQGPVTGDADHQPDQQDVLKKYMQFTQNDPLMALWAKRVLSDEPHVSACF